MKHLLQTIEWLPATHKNSVQPQITEKEEKPPEQERKLSMSPPSKARGQLKKILSQVSITAHLHVLRPSAVPDADLPPPPPLSLSPYQLVSGTNPSIAAAAAASGGGLASDEINLKLPLHETSLVAIKAMLEFLMTCYAVETVRNVETDTNTLPNRTKQGKFIGEFNLQLTQQKQLIASRIDVLLTSEFWHKQWNGHVLQGILKSLWENQRQIN